jgi:hypothetical protein
LAEIVDDLADAFGVERDEVERDCLAIVSRWLGEHLVEMVNNA